MYLSNYQFHLLKHIHKHPYISYQDLVAAYSHKGSRIRLDNNVLKFSMDDLLEITPFDSSEKDTGHRYPKGTNPSDHMHLVLSECGQAIVEDRLHKFWIFAVPYALTTFIALGGLLAQIYAISATNTASATPTPTAPIIIQLATSSNPYLSTNETPSP